MTHSRKTIEVEEGVYIGKLKPVLVLDIHVFKKQMHKE